MDFKTDVPNDAELDRLGFYPFYTPEKMLDLGVFGRSYFQMATDEDLKGLRPSILKRAIEQRGEPDWSKNAFGVQAGLDYDAWMKNGWIFPEDPLGWFHWYCRFVSGRDHARDAHQIARHNSYRRWHVRATNEMNKKGTVSKVINQGLLHWSWPVVV